MRSNFQFYTSIAAIVLYLIVVIVYVVFLLLPVRLWFKYDSIQNVNTIGGDILMASTVEKPRKSVLLYNDVLRCDFGGGYVRFSSNISQSLYNHHQKKTYQWVYEGKTPKRPGMCVMESIIKVEVPFGIVKPTGVTSPPFIYTP